MAIRSASFDDTTHTVALTFAKPILAGRSYRLITIGQGPRAITDKAGHPLGGSGTEFVARFGGLAATTGAIASRSVPSFRHMAASARGR